MTTGSMFEERMARVGAGEGLSPDEIAALASSPDILPLGMLADVVRRRLHDARVTYLRVATHACGDAVSEAVPPAARELRLTGVPASLADAVAAVARARAVAGDRTMAGLSWAAVVALATGGTTVARVLGELRQAGLDALAEVPIDQVEDLPMALESLAGAGYDRVRLTMERAAAGDRVALCLRAAALRERFPGIHAFNPLPTAITAFRPTTGYDDVKTVAIARLAAPAIPVIQVDWLRYGPKLAQVALTFGADDFDGVTALDEAPDGPRRAPLEEVRRNIETAGFTPVERDGRFTVPA